MRLRTFERLVAVALMLGVAAVGLGFMWLLAAFTDIPVPIILASGMVICCGSFLWIFGREIFR